MLFIDKPWTYSIPGMQNALKSKSGKSYGP